MVTYELRKKLQEFPKPLRSYSYVPEMHKEEKKRDFPLDYDEQQIIKTACTFHNLWSIVKFERFANCIRSRLKQSRKLF